MKKDIVEYTYITVVIIYIRNPAPSSNLSAIYDSDIKGEISDLYNIVPGKWYTYNTSTYHTPVTAFGIAKMFGKGAAPIRDNWLFIISINTSSNIHVASNINGDGWSDWKQIL